MSRTRHLVVVTVEDSRRICLSMNRGWSLDNLVSDVKLFWGPSKYTCKFVLFGASLPVTLLRRCTPKTNILEVLREKWITSVLKK